MDRITGSVLTETYEHGGGIVQEWAIVSQGREEERRGDSLRVAESVRVMAWVEMFSDKVATSWPLLRRVMGEVEGTRGARVVFAQDGGLCGCAGQGDLEERRQTGSDDV